MNGHKSAFEHAHGTDFWDYLAANPAANNFFNEGMTARAESIVDEIVAAYDFSPFARIVDVGGGAGVLLSRILEVHPAPTGILYDIAAVTQKASAYLARRGLSGRAEVIAGDFFVAVPRGDLLVLMAILHDWDNERAALILRRCREALQPTGRILIIEDILPGKVDGSMPLIEADLTMLVCHNGQERTLAEYEELLVHEGFRLESVGETASFDTLITASAAPKKLCYNGCGNMAQTRCETSPRTSTCRRACAWPAIPATPRTCRGRHFRRSWTRSPSAGCPSLWTGSTTAWSRCGRPMTTWNITAPLVSSSSASGTEDRVSARQIPRKNEPGAYVVAGRLSVAQVAFEGPADV